MGSSTDWSDWTDMDVDLSLIDKIQSEEQNASDMSKNVDNSVLESFSCSDNEPLSKLKEQADHIETTSSAFASREEFDSSDDDTLATVRRKCALVGVTWSDSEVDVSELKIPTLSEIFPESSDAPKERVCNDACQENPYDILPEENMCNVPPEESTCNVAPHANSKSDCLIQDNTGPLSEDLMSSGEEYIPGKRNDSDSNTKTESQTTDELEQEFITANRKRKQKLSARDKSWKKKRTNLNVRKCLHIRKSSGTEGLSGEDSEKETKANETDLGKAIRRSRKENNLMVLLKSVHNKRVDALLTSNGLKRQQVPADGNCFFVSLALQLQGKTAAELREEICDHLHEQYDHYIQFMTTENGEDSDEDYKKARHESEVEDLRQDGHWSVRLADFLPTAVANIYKARVVIYSSKPTQPVLELEPTLPGIIADRTLTFAYIAIRGREHYDACMDVNRKRESESQSTAEPQRTPSKRKASESHPITPRKQAKFQTPPKKRSTRKRKAHPETWKRTIRKKLRQCGKEYTSVKGNPVAARCMKSKDCSKCRFKCTEKISEEQRQNLFRSFWDLQSYEREHDFIVSHVLEKATPGVKKKVARSFTFHVNGEVVRVCRAFFVATLGISKKTVESALLKASLSALPADSTQRKRTSHNKTPASDLDDIRNHIESFPKVESHYTRKDSNRQYLSKDLSINKMYCMYKEEQQRKGKRAVKTKVYRTVFCEEYNLSFHKPKKDMCLICSVFHKKKDAGVLDSDTETAFKEHQERKSEGREAKSKDKLRAKTDNTFVVATFDMEAVLSTPCSDVSQVYYKRKLSCYNLSVYSLGDGKGYCYLWNESEGQRGSCEIGTCLAMYIKSLPPTVTRLCFFSDTCSGQNRNRYVATALMEALKSSQTLKKIDQKFLEPGHTHMECDSMHAAIENSKRKNEVFIPSQWDTIVRNARRKSPYIVVPIKHWDIVDYKILAKDTLKNVTKDTCGKRVDWRKIKQFRFVKDESDRLYFKYRLTEEDFRVIQIRPPRRGKPALSSAAGSCMPRKYQERLPITDKKKADLVSLCTANVIPQDCQAFYLALPSSSELKDKLPEPDAQEEEEDSD